MVRKIRQNNYIDVYNHVLTHLKLFIIINSIFNIVKLFFRSNKTYRFVRVTWQNIFLIKMGFLIIWITVTSTLVSSFILKHPSFAPGYSGSNFKLSSMNNGNSSEHVTISMFGKEGDTFLKVMDTSSKLKYCPQFCSCTRDVSFLKITDCPNDPSDALDPLIMHNTDATSLSITNSSLTKLPLIVCNMKKLSDLNVSDNKLVDLPWANLKELRQLRIITLSENKIRTLRNGSFYDFPSLQSLHLDNNQIDNIEDDVFSQPDRLPNITMIDLTFNKLVSLDLWPALFTNTSPVIDCRYNVISKFTNHLNWTLDCKDQKPSAIVDLSSNKITHLVNLLHGWNVTKEVDAICLLDSTFNIYLNDNPYICDCIDFSIYRFIRMIKSKHITTMYCNKPHNLYHERIVSVPLNSFICHINESCPDNCNCIDQPNQMNMSVECQNSELSHLPLKVPKLTKHHYSYHLNLMHNKIKELDYRPYLHKTRNALFSYNEIQNMSILALKALSTSASIYLDNNKLQYLPINISFVNMSRVGDLHFNENEWACDCHAKETRLWMLQMKTIISDKEGILCFTPSRLKGSNLLSLSEGDLICGDPPNIALKSYLGAGGSALAICFAFMLLAAMLKYKRIWLYRRLKWHPFDRDECLGENKKFDVFVTYANEDGDYVENYLIPNLENRGYKIAFHRVHFPGGQPITVSIEQCIIHSKRTLAVFTNNFRKSQFCMWEFTVALELDQIESTHRLVTIKYGDVDVSSLDLTLQSYFRRYSYIEKESAVFWDNLEYSLPMNKMGTADGVRFDANQINDVIDHDGEDDNGLI